MVTIGFSESSKFNGGQGHPWRKHCRFWCIPCLSCKSSSKCCIFNHTHAQLWGFTAVPCAFLASPCLPYSTTFTHTRGENVVFLNDSLSISVCSNNPFLKSATPPHPTPQNHEMWGWFLVGGGVIVGFITPTPQHPPR